jgi:phosphatidylglycerophosphatase A
MTVPQMLLTAFGLGYQRPAPGTWGSALPVAAAIALVCGGGVLGLQLNAIIVLIGVIFAIACMRFGADAESEFGRKDPGQVVADEVAGQCVAMLFLPWRAPHTTADWIWNLALAATAFFAFRFFDIVKPPPARSLQRLPGGSGILVDDLFAGVYALAVTHLAAWQLWPRLITGA